MFNPLNSLVCSYTTPYSNLIRLALYFKKISLSALSCSSRARCSVMTPPAVLKRRSEGTQRTEHYPAEISGTWYHCGRNRSRNRIRKNGRICGQPEPKPDIRYIPSDHGIYGKHTKVDKKAQLPQRDSASATHIFIGSLTDRAPHWTPQLFLQRKLAMQSTVLAIVNPSVCLSGTRWHYVKTTQATIMRSSLQDSPMTLVSSRLTLPQNSKGNMGSEGDEWQRGRKSRQLLTNKSPYLRKDAR